MQEFLTIPAGSVFHEDRAARSAQQEWINRLTERHGPAVAARAIRALAARDHRRYPQYAGYWAGADWQPAVATCDLRSKGGDQALEGDLILYRREPGYGSCGIGTFYSVRLGWNCSANFGIHVLPS